MNREIKFRAWDKNMEEMLYDFNMTQNGELIRCYSEGEEYQVDAVLMQFTGLFDKNGKNIYEGDILQHTSFERGIVKEEVYFVNGYFATSTAPLAFLLDTPNEVIANIYENPELLNPTQ